MAANAKIQKKKKRGSYDNKLILWISVGLAAFLALIIGIYLILTITTGFIGKVDGYKIYDYEYRYFLQSVLSEEYSENFTEPENYSDMTSEEVDKLLEEFWTDERKADCAQKALDDAREFKGMYSLAVKNGYKLNSAERAELKQQIDTYYNLYINYGYSSEMVLNYFFFGMSLSEYKEYAIQQSAIEKYKAVLKEKYEATDDDLRAIYEEDPDFYRLVSIRYFQVNKPKEPSKPKDANGKEISADTTNADDKAKYDDYLKDLEEYKKTLAEAKKYAEDVMNAFNAGKSYTVKDKDGKETEYKKFADLIKAESDDNTSTSNSGLFEVNSESTIDEKLKEFALSMQWDEERKQIIKVEKKDDEEEKDESSEEDKTEGDADAQTADEENTEEKPEIVVEAPMTALEIIETDSAFYVVRAENIEDFDNTKESEEGKADSIKDQIKTEWLEKEAVKELEQMVANAGSKFSIKAKKQDKIDEITASMF